MALIKCPECGQPVSDKAGSCPYCGYPIEMESGSPDNASRESSGQPAEERAAEDYRKLLDETAAAGDRIREASGKIDGRIKKIIAAVAAVAAVFVIMVVGVANANNCSASGCSNTRVSGGQYCSRHTCSKVGCKNYKNASDSYCFDHRINEPYTAYTPQVYESADVVLAIRDVKVTSNSSYTVCTGSIKNTGQKTYKFVQVKGSFKDSNGNVKDTDWTYAVGAEGLAPGETTTFRMSVDKDSKIKSCSVSLMDYDTE